MSEVQIEIKTECPVCEKKGIRILGIKNSIPIAACNVCTHVFAVLGEYDFDHKDMDNYRGGFTHGLMPTDNHYYNHLIQGEVNGFPTYITTTKVLALVKDAGITDGDWLDIGSGSGHLVQRAQECGFNVLGIEPGGWGQIAAQRKSINISQGFLEKNLENHKYSVVSATDVIEHVPDPIKFLTLMASYVEEAGVMVISVPCFDSFEAKALGMRWAMIAPPTHRHFFTKQSLSLTILKAGLRPKKMMQFNIRRLLGLSRFKTVMLIFDKLIRGDQLACMMALEIR